MVTMPLYQAQVGGAGGVALSGAPLWPDAAHQYDEVLDGTYTSNIVVSAYAGRRPIAGTPVTEIDQVDSGNQWVAANNVLTRTPPSTSVLGYYSMTRQANDGMRITLPATITSYTWAVLFRATDFSSPNGMAGFGSSTGRMGFYCTTSLLEIQHGSGDIHTGAITFPTAAWAHFLVSFDTGTLALRMYMNGVQIGGNITMTTQPSVLLPAAIGSFADNSNEASGDMPFGRLWNFPLHTDSTALANVFAALNGLKGLCP